MKNETVSHLSDIYRLIAPSNTSDDDDSDVVQIIEADEDAEKKELYSKIEELESSIANLERAGDLKNRTIEKLETVVNDYESLENETPEKLQAYAKIAALGGEPELDSKETAQILLIIQKSRKFFRSETLQIQAMYTPAVAKEALSGEVENLILSMEKWIETMRRQFDLEA